MLHLSRKIILANLKISSSKNATPEQLLSGNQRPDLLTSLMNMSLVLRLPRELTFADPLQTSNVTSDTVHNPLRLPSECPKVVRACGAFNILTWKCLRATTVCTFSASQLPKVIPAWCVLRILTSKCASRHKGVRFFDISTSKSGPNLVCFVHFDLGMCFAPQRRAIYYLASGQLAQHLPL